MWEESFQTLRVAVILAVSLSIFHSAYHLPLFPYCTVICPFLNYLQPYAAPMVFALTEPLHEKAILMYWERFLEDLLVSLRNSNLCSVMFFQHGIFGKSIEIHMLNHAASFFKNYLSRQSESVRQAVANIARWILSHKSLKEFRIESLATLMFIS